MLHLKKTGLKVSYIIVGIMITIFLVLAPIEPTVAADIAPDNNPIQHIVVIVQENRSFDEYFGTYPGADGIPPGVCMPINPNSSNPGCILPFHTHNFTSVDLQHNFSASVKDVNHGLMNGFMVGEENDTHTMAHVDNTEIPNYWTFASQYVLADKFFASIHGWSMPNHWYSIAGQAPAASIPDFILDDTHPGIKAQYLSQADAIPTIADRFMNLTTISWKYYDTHFGNIVPGGYDHAKSDGYVYDFWNPFAAKQSTYTASYAPHFVPHTQIFDDLQNNALPQVSWVIPPDYYSEHDPASIHVGMIWTTKVIDAIMNSPYWNNTVIVMYWDDWGGYYDHVSPPQIDQYGTGIRVPAMIISPYAKAGFIDHTMYTYESALKLIEWRFNVTSLTARDTNANNFLNALNFSQSPRPPTPIPISANDLAQLTPNYLIPSTGHVGDTIKFIGNGFSNLERAVVTYDNVPLGSGLANNTGSLNFNFKVPPSTAGCHWVVDTYLSGKVVFGRGLINHCYIVTPSVSLNPTVGASGTLVKINGTGFAAASSVSIKYDGVNQTTTTTNSTGSFAVPFTIPSSSDGVHTILATDANSNTGSTSFVVNIGGGPIITNTVVNTTPVWGVDPVSASGNVFNFSPSDTVTVNWGDGASTAGITITGNSWGPVSHIYGASATNTNPNQLVAKLVASNSTVKTSITTSVNVQKHTTSLSVPALNSTSVKWGKKYSVTNNVLTDVTLGQPLSGKTITYGGNGTTGLPAGVTNASGGFSSPVTITAPGIFNVGKGNIFAKFAGDSAYLLSNSAASIQITKHATALSNPTFTVPSVLWGKTFTVDSIITDTDKGVPINGRPITFSGNGTVAKTDFSNSTGHTVTTLTAANSAGSGQVSSAFPGDGNYLPSSSGISIMTITKHVTALSNPTFDRTSVPWGNTFNADSILTDSSNVGSPVSGKQVTYSGSGTSGPTPGTTNSTGHAPTTLTASSSIGTGQVSAGFAGDNNYLQSNSGSSSITITTHSSSSGTASTSLNPASGSPNSQTTVNGTGFAISNNVTIKFDGVNQTTAATDSAGKFSTQLTIPASNDGSHTILAIDSFGNTASDTFTVISIPEVTSSVNNTSPRWGIDPISASGTVVNSVGGDTVSVNWGDGTNSTGISISSNSWGPVVHTYGSNSINTNPNQVIAKLVANDNSVKASSSASFVSVRKHVTALSDPAFDLISVPWSRTVTADSILIDSETGTAISGEQITYNATNLVPAGPGTTNSTGHAPTTLTASSSIGTGQVSAGFAGDSSYLSSSSGVSTIAIRKHATTVSNPAFDLPSVPWSKTFKIDSILTDSDSGTPLSGDQISYNGNGTVGTTSGITNSTGHAPTTLTASSSIGLGQINAGFVGDSNYLSSNSTSTITIAKHATALSQLTLNVGTIKWGKTFTVTATQLTDSDAGGAGLAKTITYTGNAVTGIPTGTTTSGGTLTGPVTITASTNVGAGKTVIANFTGDSIYLPSTSAAASITINPHATALSKPTLNVGTIKWGKTFTVKTTKLTDSDAGGAGVLGKTITYTGTAVTGGPTGTTNSSGIITGPVTITASTNIGAGKTVIANFTGDSIYLPSTSAAASITINPHATALTLGTLKNVAWGQSTSFPITLKDSDNAGSTIQGKLIHYNGTGVIGVSDKTTNSTGQAVGTGTAPTGVANGWSAQGHFAGDSLYVKSDSAIKTYNTFKHATTTSLIITPGTVVHGKTYQVTGTLKDSTTGAVLSSRTITFTATSPIVISSATTSSTGAYSVTGLKAPSPGSYIIQAQFGGDSLYNSSNSPNKTLTVT